MKIHYKGKLYKISFTSYFIPSFDLETENLFKKLAHRIDGRGIRNKNESVVANLREEILEYFTKSKLERHSCFSRIRQVRETKATVYCYEDDKEINQSFTTQWIGDKDSKLTGRKVALKKVLEGLDTEFRQLAWKTFLAEYKITDSEV
jgi:hypothetical protein